MLGQYRTGVVLRATRRRGYEGYTAIVPRVTVAIGYACADADAYRVYRERPTTLIQSITWTGVLCGFFDVVL